MLNVENIVNFTLLFIIMSKRIKNKDDINIDKFIDVVNSLIEDVESWEYDHDNNNGDWEYIMFETIINNVCKEWFWDWFSSKIE